MAGERILVVEDDPELGPEIVRQLERAGFAPSWVADGEEALGAALDHFDLALLDLMLPNAYGLDILKRWRERSDIPVILLTARDHNSDKVRGLTLGADDYVTKPFWPAELVARIHARLRRGGARSASTTVRAGGIEVRLEARQVMVNGAPVELARAELAIMETLARRAGHAISRADLADAALDGAREGSDRALDVHVSRLRKKLGAEGARIATVWGIGYRLEVS